MPSHASADLERFPQILEELAIPFDFARSEYLAENAPVSSLETWKQKSLTVLQEILDILKRINEDNVTLKMRGDVVFAVAPFSSRQLSVLDGDSEDEEGGLQPEPWLTSEAQALADELFTLPQFSHPSRDLVSQVLTQNLKPIFQSNPHPHLHLETGRKLPKAAGGSMAMQDYYEGQRWKEYPGVDKVVFWCVRSIESNSYENMWHLIIPPVMTLLDDFEAKHKLQGVFVVQEMLHRVPSDLLKRTGVDGLLRQSLKTSLSHLQSPETAPLLKNAIFASISLINLTTSVSAGSKPTAERFDQLSSLLGEGIISGIWLYAEDKPGVIQATFDTLPQLLRALGIGSVRFLKALMPQVAHQLIPRTLVDSDRRMQLSALRVLGILLEVCKPRINSWKETILDAVGRCWVGLIDEEREGIKPSGFSASPFEIKSRNDIKKSLQITCVQLAEICPSVVQGEFQRFLIADRKLFEDLFPRQMAISP